jgi:1,4-alpha-glucan branching enzyme
MKWVADLNRIYGSIPDLYEYDCNPDGFRWIDANDAEQSVLSFVRRGKSERSAVVVVLNFTPVPRHNYRIGVPGGGFWPEVLNSDSREYGGSGQGNLGGVEAAPIAAHGQPWSLILTAPPLGAVFFQGRFGPAHEVSESDQEVSLTPRISARDTRT